jgi:naphtho-gamma-pyrone polyketide synthase
MSLHALYIFGDQTGEIVPPLQELSRLSQQCNPLRDFLSRATDRLRMAVAKAPSHQRRRFPSFETLSELAVAMEKEGRSPALMTALLCVSQIGHFIVYGSLFCRNARWLIV